jgi:hypothetical protein
MRSNAFCAADGTPAENSEVPVEDVIYSSKTCIREGHFKGGRSFSNHSDSSR